MKHRTLPKTQCLAIIVMLSLFLLGFARIHTRVETVNIGYEIGKLKQQEKALIEERSRLQMELSKLTTKDTLKLMAEKERTIRTDKKPLAARF